MSMRILENVEFPLCLRSLLPASKLTVEVQTPDRDEEAIPAPVKPEGIVRMANLCVIAGNKVNGVAAIHTQIVKEEVFRDFYKVCGIVVFNPREILIFFASS